MEKEKKKETRREGKEINKHKKYQVWSIKETKQSNCAFASDETGFMYDINQYFGSINIFLCLLCQALGIPTGSHGAFRDYQVDAVTMEISHRLSSTNKGRQTELLFRGGRYTLQYDSGFLLDSCYQFTLLFYLIVDT